ncbi:hypothetical protein ACE1B6_20590 [Aerosakkonemataceae cyanobacterium BLCC-F154]|uniref:Mid2 domain-containing protein n=1 Tax=Floridaenema fluviatile BLCC-F154 TaxID=3153640 RepID=A0ABV4YG51_9CYAN
MYNDDDKRTTYNRGVNPEPNQNNYSEVPRNTETVNNIPPEEYRDGYVHGRIAERRYNEDNRVVRENNNAARGLILGIVLTSLVAIPALAYYLWRQSQEPVVAPEPVPAPVVVPSPSPEPQPTIIQERVIERNPEVQVVPVPQRETPTTTTPAPNINIEQSAPTPQATPNVNITVPPTTGQQQSPDSTQQLPANQQTENQSSTNSTQQLPSIQGSPSPGVSDSTNPNLGNQSNPTTSGDDISPDGTTTTPGTNTSPSTTNQSEQ